MLRRHSAGSDVLLGSTAGYGPGQMAPATPEEGAMPGNRSSAESPNQRIRPRRPYGRMVMIVALCVAGAMMLHSLISNSAFDWPVVGQYLFAAPVISGLVLTLELTFVAMAIGILLGVVLAVMRISRSQVISGVSSAYIWFFRGTPVLVQLIIWYNLAALYSNLALGIPFGPRFVTMNTNSVITALGAAVMGLGLNEAAYMAEIVRAGLLSVPAGQLEAAAAVGLRPGTSRRLIALPQAMRVIIPPTGNEVISMLKTSSLVSVIGTAELLYSVEIIYARTFQTIPLLMVACIWYLTFTTALSILQYYIERHYGRSVVSSMGERSPLMSKWKWGQSRGTTA
jgi:polar amino acid transport system permease protein